MQTENFKTSLCSVPVEGTNFEIRILGQRRSATVLHEAAYDPQNLRLKDI